MKNMIKTVILSALFLSTGALASGLKIGVVDVERLLRESQPAIQAEKKIEKIFLAREQKIKQLATQLKNKQTRLDREAGNLSDSEFRQRERNLNTQRVNLQRMQREFSEDLNMRKNEELALIMEQANRAIKSIAQREQYDLILQDVVYRNPSLDMTNKVIQYLSRGR